MILRQAKNPRSGRACAPGGRARQEAGDPPPNGRAVGFLNAYRTRGPLWAERSIPRAEARAAGGGPGEGKPQRSRLGRRQDLLGTGQAQAKGAFQPSAGPRNTHHKNRLADEPVVVGQKRARYG